MTNIIVGNVIIFLLTVIADEITSAAVHSAEAHFVIQIIIAVLATVPYYFLGKHIYSMKLRKALILAIVSSAVLLASHTLESAPIRTGLGLLEILTMGPWLSYYVLAADSGSRLFYTNAVTVFQWIPYALICLGIMVGRRKNREQYEAFVAIEKEQKEQRKAYREERKKKHKDMTMR